ncbi:P-loop containing nucleoside triphosphate hydrolase protein [Auriscalpium vulgare]|uniref:P-loop containing nucleoside triphosphate hydrolase protein n=1 Tax=Auriscalpium vulgare TaxID=40419 RepID=A0ACB8RKL4_9AGAM|nr:P-loop containing nucleoside triphosphate hydrolase protein [Auriscalpium vulgare]
MPRRTQHVVHDDDSQKENSPATARVKPEAPNGKGKKRDFDSMPGRADLDGDREGSEEDAEGSEDDGEGEEEDQGEGSPKGAKRARVGEDGEGRAAPAVKSEKKARGRAAPQPVVRDLDGYNPGSIVRVKLHNFVTYDQVEFRPGPHLNMIIGPNGTGKSTIACAIALGLNFPPSILGRAAELNSFVKMGTEEGYIEIELKGKIGKQNLVIRRNLSAKSKTTSFTVNGAGQTGKEVAQKMAELNIQVGNLCAFLPQDKVSEFAHMSPQQLLRETELAAGDNRLTAWHDTLVSAGKELHEVTDLLTADRAQMKTLEERNAMLERDVQRFKERQELQKQIGLIELILPFIEYVEARKLYSEAKEKQRTLHRKVQMLQQKNAPMHEFKKRLESHAKRLNELRDDKKRAAQKKFKLMGTKYDETERYGNQQEEISNRLLNLKKDEKQRLQKIQSLERSIADQQKQLDKPVEMEKPEDIQAELRALSQEGMGHRNKQDELQERQQRNIEESSRAEADIREGGRSLQQLDNVAHQKLENLSRFDPDCATTIRWLRENRSRFRMEIVEPAIVSVTVPNKQYVNAVEACFGGNQMKTFVAQCDEDYRLFNRLLADSTEALGRKMRVTSWYRPDDQRNRTAPPMSPEELRSLGFDGYALDFVECSDAMKGFLMRDVGLHRTAVALNPARVDGQRAMEAVSRSGGGSYIVGMTMNQVTRSRYGRQLAQNLTRDIRPARNLVGPTVDLTVKRDIQRRIGEAEDRARMAREEANKLGDEDRELKAMHNEFKRRWDAVDVRKKKVAETRQRLARLSGQLQANKARLEEQRNIRPAEAEREKLKQQLLDLTRKRALIAGQYAELVRAAIADQVEATKTGLQFLQICSNKKALEALIDERDVAYQQALAAFTEAHKVYENLKVDSKTKLDISKEKLEECDDELREQFRAMEENGTAHERDSAQLRDELETLQQKLELVLQTNPGVIEQYERRKAEIEALTRKIEERERKAGKVEKSIKTARDNWQPALEDLVHSIGEKFSAAFDRIGCAGELQLTPHDDYDKWAITILVKFRDTEKLQQLTAHRQSGGERSLTTILYLMSMTEHARAPFSLVDEINQGMDQRAERAVHNELVKTTCTAESGQYFLITPKLLPDLKYDPLMKVLCVNNGEWLPEDNQLGNMMSMVKTFVKRQQASAASA